MVHPNRFDYKGRSILFIINDNAFCASYHQSFPTTPIIAPTLVFPIANQHKEMTQVNKQKLGLEIDLHLITNIKFRLN